MQLFIQVYLYYYLRYILYLSILSPFADIHIAGDIQPIYVQGYVHVNGIQNLS